MGVDDEFLYIDIGPQHLAPPIPCSQPGTKKREEDNSEPYSLNESDSANESFSDDEVEEDGNVKDRELA